MSRLLLIPLAAPLTLGGVASAMNRLRTTGLFLAAGICAIALLTIAAPAGAFWTGAGTGSGAGTVATMPAGNQPTASASGQSVTVSWTQSSFLGSPLGSFGGGGYTLTRYASAGTTPLTPNAGCAATVVAAAQCVEANVPYGAWRYSVTPLLHDFVGTESAKSATVTVAPAAPVITVTAQNPTTAQTTGDINVSWAAVTGAAAYNVYRRPAGGAFDFGAPLSSGPTTAFVDSTAAVATTYHYVVRAIAGSPSVESDSSASASATTITRPPAPSGVTATATAGAHVGVAWSSVSGVAGYNVYRRTTAGAYDLAAPRNGATLAPASLFDDSAVNATSYNYVVRAVIIGAGGVRVESASSSETAAVIADGSPAAAANTLTVTSGGNVKSGSTCGVSAGTRFVNNAGESSVGVTVTLLAAPEAGETFVFSATTPGSPTFATTVPATGTSVSTTLDLSSIQLLEGVVTLTVRTKDAVGNLSAIKAPSNVVIKDTVAPTTLSATYHALGGGGGLGLEAHIDGTSECGAIVSAQKTTGGAIKTATAGTGGAYDIALGLLNGGTWNVWSTDLAGNVGASITT